MQSELSEKLRQSAAKSTLNGLMIWLGEPGLAAARESVGLMSLVDQHAAAVRDALGDPAAGLGAVSLAGYAAGVRDALIEADWRVPAVAEQDWSKPEWPTVRLLAICSLARSHGYV
jgi:uncharacterized protein DUF6401